jgi:UDPglucose 6-dehydrogenase
MLDSLKGKKLAVLGLAFKPNTSDTRESPAIRIIDEVLKAGATVRAYDPVAMDNARRSLPQAWQQPGKLLFAANQYDALAGADGLALVTEWKPFRQPDFGAMKKLMKLPVIFDGRNQYDPQQARAAGFEYFGIGR